MPESERAVFRVLIRGTVDAVWHEITKTDSVQQCMFNMRLATPGLAPGAPMQMRTKSGKYVGVRNRLRNRDHRSGSDALAAAVLELDHLPQEIGYR